MNSKLSKPQSSEIDKGHFDDFYLKQNDEIDLFELFSVLYKSKFVIIGVTLLFAIVGFTVASFLPQKWTSQAAITKPMLNEMKQLTNTLTELSLVDVDTGVNASSVYQKFINNYNSRVLREEFLVSTDYYKKLLAKIENPTPLDQRRLIEDIVTKDISLKASDGKDKDDEFSGEINLSFTAPTSDAAYDLLSGYIRFISTQVRIEVKDEIDDQIERKLSFAQKAYEMDLERIANARNITVQRLKYALEIANAAGVKKPISSEGAQIKDDPDYSIAMGSDALSSKLTITESIKDPTTISAELKNRLYNIQQLEKVKLDELQFVPFKYMMKPYEPTKKDAPKRALILVGAAFVGFILSVMAVLLGYMVRSRRKTA
ncbi:O-antigen lipopolysaccharide chain length regulator [Proteus hauseri ATCC 700826]|uniref:O-antigen lipopolysaccharide chain length regulator n=1 Tax=Proteus hauseri ATCC 700826 TaxID=1354271 RepID=A0AAJ3HQE1_PROHU|nr:LPS O-antigen length regulator Wzz(fepE) [Proteus hauseri]OAT45428.1 O-antigen lipopolysaccharide chain length regulator [Proteus hauseri ATCC 700826]